MIRHKKRDSYNHDHTHIMREMHASNIYENTSQAFPDTVLLYAYEKMIYSGLTIHEPCHDAMHNIMASKNSRIFSVLL